MSEPRQAVDFLRRRYANAIMRDDMDTACRLRLQLDAIMNRARRGHAADAGASAGHAGFVSAPAEPRAAPPQRELRLLVTRPVTGLLESRRQRVARLGGRRIDVACSDGAEAHSQLP